MWFRVDDNLHDHRKTRKVRRSHPEKGRDAAPMGLWVLAGSWAGRNLTSGFVPLEVLEDWDDQALELAKRLVAAGLWSEEERDGEPGYLFKDWEERNPEKADGGVLGNHNRWHVKRGKRSPNCPHCEEDQVGSDQERITSESHATRSSDRTRIGDAISRPVPTRTPNGLPSSKLDTEAIPIPVPIPVPVPAVPVPDLFDEFWKLYPRKEAKGAAIRAWKGAKAKADQQVIVDALTAQLPWMETQKRRDGDYRPLPSSWLNQERWTDERKPSPQSSKSHLPEAWR